MKKAIAIITLFLSISIYAQGFQGKATYKTHRKVDFKMKDKKGNNSDFQKQLQAQLLKQFQKTYTLNFSKTESTYKQNAALSAPQAQNGVSIKIMGNGGGTDVLYKNIADKRFVNKTEISGKRFLIKDKLSDFDWEMTTETKNIGNYTCYKATKKREEKRTSFSMTDGEREEKKEKVTIETVAWYTPQVAVSNGPGSFWGLPGLILEIQDGKQTIVCTEIVMNPSDKVQIKEPSKGKKVTQKKFDKIMEKHSKEMMERFKSKRKSKDGNSFSIEIQG
ncbi:GLPGLI family protein [Tenacibaculum sp. AHE15PA]|uniref:GLPGLI family protein n=1 Tax=unclassified Tenacibaculum TaxID=2635139 RepID=UPI001C4E50CC|nr:MULTISPECIES: GLPGLI family protein [unclassified Tenacibaculum]QXP72709.1 GLPGLI family protein [Tenacibaculum sp. AHE14PA]QXP76624.1 GLPGLI family protein [Tenacibaculum sp. AHE15PA]